MAAYSNSKPPRGEYGNLFQGLIAKYKMHKRRNLMHFNRVGLSLKPKKRLEIKRYLTLKMNYTTIMINKYGEKVLERL